MVRMVQTEPVHMKVGAFRIAQLHSIVTKVVRTIVTLITVHYPQCSLHSCYADANTDTDTETDRLLGQTRTEDDCGFFDEKVGEYFLTLIAFTSLNLSLRNFPRLEAKHVYYCWTTAVVVHVLLILLLLQSTTHKLSRIPIYSQSSSAVLKRPF